jgi:cell division protein FtsI (penicillin-binding protein 3)
MAKTKKDIFWRISLAYICVVLIGVAIVYKVFKIQNIEGAYWRSLSDSLTTKYFTVEPERGNIYSSDGKLLATSLPVFEIRMDMMADGLTRSPSGTANEDLFYHNVVALGDSLSALFKDETGSQYANQLINAKRSKERYHLVKNNVPYIDLIRLKKFPLFRFGQNKGGIIVVQKNKRVYPYNLLANRTIGYVRENQKPVGLEAHFNSALSGVPGKRLEQKVGGGNWIPLNDEEELDPQNGKDVYTTLDLGLQDLAENALLKTLVKNKADHGCVIVMEVKTGKIKAMANLGKMGDSLYAETFNYAIGEAHEPGSTFKLASMMSMLEDGYININDTVDIEHGKKRYYNQIMKDAEESGSSRMTIKSAFAHSSNVGISKLVTEYYTRNPDQYIAHLKKFDLDKPIGFEVPGESSPDIKNTNDPRWSNKVSLPWMSVGYELSMTPIRLITFYNSVANNGVMVKPYIVEAVKEYGKPVQEFQPVVLNPKICSDKTLATLHTLLEDVILEGTAHNLLNPNYSIAGKTGTAQIADDKRGYEKRVYQASFIGYFPADNPVYTIAVVINNPTNGVYYGAEVAAPVFKEIADNVYASNLDMHPQMAFDTKNHSKAVTKTGFKDDVDGIYDAFNAKHVIVKEGSWMSSFSKDSSIVMQSKEDADVSYGIPNVMGMGLRDAMYLLENKGLQVATQGYGTVISQSLKPGGDYKKGQTILLLLGL